MSSYAKKVKKHSTPVRPLWGIEESLHLDSRFHQVLLNLRASMNALEEKQRRFFFLAKEVHAIVKKS